VAHQPPRRWCNSRCYPGLECRCRFPQRNSYLCRSLPATRNFDGGDGSSSVRSAMFIAGTTPDACLSSVGAACIRARSANALGLRNLPSCLSYGAWRTVGHVWL
jgi:hypothetical protein